MDVTVCHGKVMQFALLHRLCNNHMVTTRMTVAGLVFSFNTVRCRVEPVPAQPVAAEPVLAEATAAAAEAEVSPAVEIEAAAVDVSGPNKMERALAAQQVSETSQIMCMACQVVVT